MCQIKLRKKSAEGRGSNCRSRGRPAEAKLIPQEPSASSIVIPPALSVGGGVALTVYGHVYFVPLKGISTGPESTERFSGGLIWPKTKVFELVRSFWASGAADEGPCGFLPY